MKHHIFLQKAYTTGDNYPDPFWMSYCQHPNGKITRMVPVDFRGHFFSWLRQGILSVPCKECNPNLKI